MPHDNALRRAIADVLLTFEDWPQHQSSVANAERATALNNLRAAADALAAGGKGVPFDDAVQTLDRIRGAAQHCECQSYELAHACMSHHNGFNAARRAEEPRHD